MTIILRIGGKYPAGGPLGYLDKKKKSFLRKAKRIPKMVENDLKIPTHALTRKLSKTIAHAYWYEICCFEQWREQAYPVNASDRYVMREPEILAYISHLEITGKKLTTIKNVLKALRKYAVSTRQGDPCGARTKKLLQDLTKKHTKKKDQ